MNAHKLPSGNYRVQGTYKDRNGNTIRKSFTAKTAKEAMRKAYEFDVLSIAKSNGEITLKDAMSEFNKAKSVVLSPSTIRSYYSLAENAFTDILNVNIDQITNRILQDWVNKYSVDRTPKTVRNAYGYLESVFKFYKIKSDFDITLPAKKKVEYHIITDEEIKTLLNATKGTQVGIAIALAAFIPARRSEICALRQSDIDREKNTVHICKAVVQNEIGQWVCRQNTKTYEGTRTVEVPKTIIDMIPADCERIIDYNPDSLYSAFKRTIKKLGYNFRFHDLRHWSASYLHSQGVPERSICSRGGWSDIGTLQRIYTHCLPEGDNAATAAVNAKFNSICT